MGVWGGLSVYRGGGVYGGDVYRGAYIGVPVYRGGYIYGEGCMGGI